MHAGFMGCNEGYGDQSMTTSRLEASPDPGLCPKCGAERGRCHATGWYYCIKCKVFTPEYYNRFYLSYGTDVDERLPFMVDQCKGYTVDLGAGCCVASTLKPGMVSVDWSFQGLKRRKVDTDKICADTCHLPFRDGLFDSALCSETMEHLPQPDKFVEEAARILKTGGIMTISVPAGSDGVWPGGGEPSPSHMQHYTEESLLSIIKEKEKFNILWMKISWGKIMVGAVKN